MKNESEDFQASCNQLEMPRLLTTLIKPKIGMSCIVNCPRDEIYHRGFIGIIGEQWTVSNLLTETTKKPPILVLFTR